MPKKLRKSLKCLNCGTAMADYNYCPECGQINTTKQVPLKLFFHDILGDYFTFDSRFFRSFIPLLRQPGHLTNEYNSGRRVSYILPLRLYLFVTILFFFIISLQGKIGLSSLEPSTVENQVVNRDSIQAIFTKYDGTIPEDVQASLISEIDNKYKLTKRKREIKFSVGDSLNLLLSNFDAAISESDRHELALEIMSQFKFYPKKGRRNRGGDKKALKKILGNSEFLPKANKTDQLFKAIDSRFRFRKIVDKAAGHNYYIEDPDTGITVDGTPVDSLEAGIEKNFLLKANALAKKGAEGGRLFWQEVLNQIPKVMFLILPIFALILKVLYIRKKIYYINHLIFSLHAHTILFLYLLFAILFPKWYVITPVVFGIWVHLFFSMRNVYKQSRLMTMLKLNLLLFLYTFPLICGFALLSVLAVVNV